MVQSKNTSVLAILGFGGIAALLIIGSGHVAIPFSYKHFGKVFDDGFARHNFNYDDDDDDDDDDDKKHFKKHFKHTSSAGGKNKINIKAKDGSIVEISCSILQSQTLGFDPLLIQKAANICASNIGGNNNFGINSGHHSHGAPLLSQEAANICDSNIGNKNKINIKAKDGSIVEVTCIISQTQTVLVDPPLVQDSINVCASNIGNKNKIKIEAKDGSIVEVTCIVTQTQTVNSMTGFGDPLLSQQSFNICGSNIGNKNKIEIKATDGSTVIITCSSTQTQSVMAPMMPTPVPPDPIQESTNICGSNIGDKNKIKIEAKDGSNVIIVCDNSQLQSMSVDPLLSQQSTNLCGSNLGDKNKLNIKAKDGSTVTIICGSNQVQIVGDP